MTNMDRRVLAYVNSQGGRATVSQVQKYFTAQRAAARASLASLRSARLLKLNSGAFDFYEITDAGRNAL